MRIYVEEHMLQVSFPAVAFVTNRFLFLDTFRSVPAASHRQEFKAGPVLAVLQLHSRRTLAHLFRSLCFPSEAIDEIVHPRLYRLTLLP